MAEKPAGGQEGGRLAGRLARVLIFVLSIALFVVAIELIKAGSSAAASLVTGLVELNSVPNALGFGWLAAYLVMSGSPVAALSVIFLSAGVLSRYASFAMLVGSRLGASFIVLFIGFIYVLRGHERRTGLTMGLLALMVTISTYLPALVLGLLLLESHALDLVHLEQGAVLGSILDRFLQPIVALATGLLPGWAVMLLGLGVLWVAFYLFDRALPSLDLERSRFSLVARLVYRPLIMFLLGAGLTLITLSVSLSLSLLVPLSARGYVRRENAIPYVMGANITTFVDTLLATVLLGSSDAFTVVLVSMVSVSAISLVVLLLFFRRYERAVLGLVEWAIGSNRNLALFMLAILFVPLILMLI